MMCSSAGRSVVDAHACLTTPRVTACRFARRRFPGEAHYGARGHDGDDLAFLFFYQRRFGLIAPPLNDRRCGRELDFRPVAPTLLSAKEPARIARSAHPPTAPSCRCPGTAKRRVCTATGVLHSRILNLGDGRSSSCKMEQNPAMLAVDCIGLVLGKPRKSHTRGALRAGEMTCARNTP